MTLLFILGYQVTIKKSELGVSRSAVVQLMELYLGKGHILCTHNWYISPNLFQFLHSDKTGACGTVKANHTEMPELHKVINWKLKY